MVTMRTAIVYAPDGAVTGLRQDWTFDDMYTAFAMTGLEAKKKGQFTRAELQPLAQVNIESLKDFDYFTYARIDGKRRQSDAFAAPVDYWLDYDAEAAELTLHFTLPFKEPIAAKRLVIEIYDPEFFIDMEYADKSSVGTVGTMPARCRLKLVQVSADQQTLQVKQMLSTKGKEWKPPANEDFGGMFAQPTLVVCS